MKVSSQANTSGIPGYIGTLGNILDDNSPGTNNCSPTDPDTLQNRRIVTDPYIIFDFHGADLDDRAFTTVS
jgi:hypothetical protein